MVSLVEVNETNYLMVCGLKVTDEQAGYVATPTRILASAYAMQNQNARVWAVTNDEIIVGVLMVKDLLDEPVCYTIEQFMIDHKYQNRGYGGAELKLVIDALSAERKHDIIDICVKIEDKHAIRLYEHAGFVDTGYIDPENPDSFCLRYTFGHFTEGKS